MILRSLLLLSFVCLSGCGVTAPKSNDGFADLDGFSWADVDTVTTISIGPSVLRFAAAFMDDEPETQAILRRLEGVRVKVYAIEEGYDEVAIDLDRMSRDLRTGGWEQAVRVVEGPETTHVLVKIVDDGIAGLSVLSADGEEIVLVNVMGDLRPEMFTRTMSALDVPVPSGMES